jgi:hypothetical protein
MMVTVKDTIQMSISKIKIFFVIVCLLLGIATAYNYSSSLFNNDQTDIASHVKNGTIWGSAEEHSENGCLERVSPFSFSLFSLKTRTPSFFNYLSLAAATIPSVFLNRANYNTSVKKRTSHFLYCISTIVLRI